MKSVKDYIWDCIRGMLMKNFSHRVLSLVVLMTIGFITGSTDASLFSRSSSPDSVKIGRVIITNSTKHAIPYTVIAGDEKQRPSKVVAQDTLESHRKVEFDFKKDEIYIDPVFSNKGKNPYYRIEFTHGWLKIGLAKGAGGALVPKNIELIDAVDHKDKKYIGSARIEKIFNNGQYLVRAEIKPDGLVNVDICCAAQHSM
jgi:hypothetical protein